MQNRPETKQVAKVRILTKHCACAVESRFGPRKKLRKQSRIDSEKRSKKASQKNVSKSDAGLHFGPPKPSESLPKSNFPNLFANLFEACFAKLWDLPASRAELAEIKALRLSPWSFKGLGLLSLSLC